MVTAYDAPAARLADAAGVDMILVGDSAAMVVLGHDSTVPGDDGRDARPDARGHARRAAPARRRRPAVRLVPGLRRAGARERDPLRQGGGRRRGEARGRRADALARARDRRRGDPRDGPHRPDAADRRRCSAASRRRAGPPRRRVQLYEDALALEAAGCFAIVLEAVPAPVAARDHRGARRSRRSGSAPAPDCDGQVLVWHDLLGLYEGHAPRFVKQYAEPRADDRRAVERYASEVRDGAFPEEQHTYAMPEDELALFEEALAGRQSELSASASTIGGDERERARGDCARPGPAVHGTDADDEQHGRPDEERELDQRRRRARLRPCRRRRCGTSRRRRARASPARATSDERERHEREREHVARRGDTCPATRAPSRAPCSTPPNAKYAEEAVDAAGEERPDRDERPSTSRRRSDARPCVASTRRDAREQHDREHRLGAVGAASRVSSRSAANTGRGRCRTSSVLSHQSRIAQPSLSRS